MNIFRLLILTLSFYSITECYAQRNSQGDATEIQILGLIVSEGNAEKIPYVHILNKNSTKGTISNLSGEFSISVSRKDTLVFSAVGYEDLYFTLSESEITSNTYSLKIALNPSTLVLSPVAIFAFKSEMAFKNDILKLQIADSQKEILIPGAFYGTPEPAKTEVYIVNMGVTGDGCLTSLVNLFKRQANEAEQLAEQKNFVTRQQKIYKKYNPEIVNEITGLTGDNLSAFLAFCEIKDEFVLEANEYEIFMVVNDSFKSFYAQRE